MTTLMFSTILAIMGPIIPQNTLKVAVQTAVKEAVTYTDTRARAKPDLTVYEPLNEHWVWTTNDPNCPADFLPAANRYGAPKPRCVKDAYGVYHWAYAVFFNPDGNPKYMCFLHGGKPTDTKITFQFSIEAKSGLPAFSATATRKSATDTTPVPVDGVAQLAVVGDDIMPYASKKRLGTYLYEMQYDKYDIEYAKEYFRSQYVPPTNTLQAATRLQSLRRLGGCSGLRNGNFFGRNFDWEYNDEVTVVIRVPEDTTTGRQASLGVCYAQGLTEEVLQSSRYDPLFKILPFHTVDGINQSGVYIQDNVCPPGDYGYTTSTSTNAKHRVAGMMVVRYVLDHATNAVHACNIIKNDLDIYGYYSKNVKDELHYMIGDENNTFIVEIISNKVEVIDVADRPIMTNFHIWNTSIKDGAIDMDSVTPHANGIERYNILLSNRDSANSLDGMANVMKMVEYTKAYSSDPFWYSELYGDNLTKDSPLEDFKIVKQYMLTSFHNRDRLVPYLGQIWTWQTCHLSVYDLKHKMLWLIDQERDPSTGSYFLFQPERIRPQFND